MTRKPYLYQMMSRIEDWSEYAEPKHKYMTVNNSSCHMSIFPEFYTNIESIKQQLKIEKEDAMTYSITSIVWDLYKKKALYVFHEIDKLPRTTSEDMALYEKEQQEKEEIIRKREEIKFQNEKYEQHIRECKMFIDQKETEYIEYVKDCAVLGYDPKPFWEFASFN